MRTHLHSPRPLLRIAVSFILTAVSLAYFATPSPLHAQPTTPPSCTTVAERSVTAPNVVWGNRAPDTPERDCEADSSDDVGSVDCDAFRRDLAWFWEGADLVEFDATGGCCGACTDAPEADGEPARGATGPPEPNSTRSSMLEPWP